MARKTPAEYAKERATRLKAQKKCVQCGESDENTLAGHVHCKQCSEKFNGYFKNMYRERMWSGRCVRCGKVSDGYSYCKACRKKNAERYRSRKALKNK